MAPVAGALAVTASCMAWLLCAQSRVLSNAGVQQVSLCYTRCNAVSWLNPNTANCVVWYQHMGTCDHCCMHRMDVCA